MLKTAKIAQKTLSKMDLKKRIAICHTFLEKLDLHKDQIARDITCEMGKPIQQSFNEINTLKERTYTMINLAEEALKPDIIQHDDSFVRKIIHQPLGIILVIAPWNYPLITAGNAVIPAILSGNAVIIKPSSLTPSSGRWFEKLFGESLDGCVTNFEATHQQVENLINQKDIQHVSFTGGVNGGHQIYQTIAKNRFIDVTLELGGKDPAYVAEDANIDLAVSSVIDGAYYNAGQSCCGVERAYVHKDRYDEFLNKACKLVENYKVGDSMDFKTTLGPLAEKKTKKFLDNQIKDAISKGAKIIAESNKTDNPAFFPATLLADCNNNMNIMREESFGPVLGIMKVDSDKQALNLINDSDYGLTVSIFSESKDKIDSLALKIQTGTVFGNRCDYLDPELAWTGVKNTGKGISLSKFGFFTKRKSLHYKF